MLAEAESETSSMSEPLIIEGLPYYGSINVENTEYIIGTGQWCWCVYMP